MKCILVRHGETEWNSGGRFQGQSDVDLSERGLEQAKAVAKRLSETMRIDAIYSSDLKRAHLTALEIAKATGLDVRTSRDLRETDVGQCAGLSYEEIKERFPDYIEARKRDFGRTRFPGGECMADVEERMVRVVREIVQAHPGQNVVVVSHGAALRILVGAMLGMTYDATRAFILENGSVTVLEFPEGADVQAGPHGLPLPKVLMLNNTWFRDGFCGDVEPVGVAWAKGEGDGF